MFGKSIVNNFLLKFNEKGIECEYRFDTDKKNIRTYRISLFIWIGIYIAILFELTNLFPSLDPQIKKMSYYLYIIFGLFPVAIAYFMTLKEKHYSKYHIAMIFVFIGAGILQFFCSLPITKFSHYIPDTIAGFIMLMFVSRVQFRIAFILILLNTIIFHLYDSIINLNKMYGIIIYPTSIVLPFIFISIAGFILEKNTRTIFLQNITIRKQQELIRDEQEKSEKLLLNILPEEIMRQLKNNVASIAKNYDNVSVLFSDIVGFTNISSKLKPEEVINILNEIFSRFDVLVNKYNIEKIKTIGDAYMVVAGAPKEELNHAKIIIEFAKEMISSLDEYNINKEIKINIRIGISSGPIVAGIIGKKKFHYDLWGDTVNTASRMESNGVLGRIQISEMTENIVHGLFEIEPRGNIEIKGKGQMKVYLIKNEK